MALLPHGLSLPQMRLMRNPWLKCGTDVGPQPLRRYPNAEVSASTNDGQNSR
jgi:hypothetical protein